MKSFKNVKIVLVGILLLSLLITGCKKKETQTYARVGERTMNSSLYFPFVDFREFYECAEILAEVEVTKWLGESDVSSGVTIFEAKLLKTYKNTTGEELEHIELVQNGNSAYTLQGYPLFGIGDKLLVALQSMNPYIERGFYSNLERDVYQDRYIIEGASAGVFQIVEENAAEYMIGYQSSPLPELSDLESKCIGFENLTEIQSRLNNEISASLSDKSQKDNVYRAITSCPIFNVKDFVDLVEKQK